MASIDDVVESSHKYYPASKWEKVGDSLTGEVLDAWMQPKRKYQSTEIEVWEDGENKGKPKYQLVLNWTVDGEAQTIYSKFPAQLAIFDAVRRSRGKLSEGGTLTVTRTPDGEPPKKGFRAPLQFGAEFVPTGASGSDLDDV